MIFPYVYKLTHKETGQFYIGYRCANKVIAEEDIGYRYCTSSKTVKSIGIDKFNIEILAVFFKAEDAYDFEQDMIIESYENLLCLNLVCHYGLQKKFRYDPTGKKLSIETKQKISESHKGKTVSIETKNKIAKANIGRKHSEETKKRMSIDRSGCNNVLYGKTLSEETKKRMSIDRSGCNNVRAKAVIVNGITYKTIKDAALSNNYKRQTLNQILKNKRQLNTTIWQAEYFNKDKE